MRHFKEYVLWALVLYFQTCYAQPSTSERPDNGNLGTFVADNVRFYGELSMSLPYNVPEKNFRGGDVASNYIVNINETKVTTDANWGRNPEIILNATGTIQIRYHNFFQGYSINGDYDLQGLENAVPVFGKGSFNISTSLTELNFYFFYEVDFSQHLSIIDAFTYYSSYQPTAFAFTGTNSSTGGAYQKSIGTAISQFSMEKMTIYHQNGLLEFLRCLFDKITIQEIEAGEKINPCKCTSECNVEPSEPPTTEEEMTPTTEEGTTEIDIATEEITSPTIDSSTTENSELPSTIEDFPTTKVSTTIRPITTTPNPDIPFNCSGKPDGYYQHPSNCSKFLGCLNGVVREYSCPTFLVFNPDRSTCVHLNEYTCPRPIFSCTDMPDGYYASPVDCAQYFGCLDGKIFKELSCLFNYYFDQNRQQCVPQSQSDCYRQFELFEETHRAFHL